MCDIKFKSSTHKKFSVTAYSYFRSKKTRKVPLYLSTLLNNLFINVTKDTDDEPFIEKIF